MQNKLELLEKISKEFSQNDFYKFLNEIPDTLKIKDKIPIWCNKHQLKFYKSLEMILYQHSCNCPACSKELANYDIHLKEDILQKLSKEYLDNDFYKFKDEIPELIDTIAKIPIWCKKHQIKFYKSLHAIFMRHTCNCKKCTTNIISKPELRKDIFLKTVTKEFSQNDFYKFSDEILVEYLKVKDKIPVWCNKHQLKFYKRLEMILYRHSCNCPKCREKSNLKKLDNKEQILEKLSEEYPNNDFYKFLDEIDLYIKTNDKIPIWCKKHQIKFYKDLSHINSRHSCNCPICGKEKPKKLKRTLSEQVEIWKNTIKDNIIYDHIDLSLDRNYDNKTKITLTCPKHGDFITTVGSRNCKSGCLECYRERQHAGINLLPERRITKEMWIKRFKTKYIGFNYDYSLIKEIPNQLTKLPIICPKHGVFYRNANKFYYDNRICPKCRPKSINEEIIANWLNEHQINYKREKTYSDLIGLRGQPLRYDFYLIDYDILIEFDGIVHFEDRYNRPEIFEMQKKHDKMKTEYAQIHNIQLIRSNRSKKIIAELEKIIK